MPQINHRVGDGFECVVQFADALETKQQSLELVFPAEDPLNGVESLLENGGINHWFGSALWRLSAARIGVDVGSHPAVENGFAIDSAIVGAIQTDDGSPQAKTGGFGNRFELRQGLSKHGGFITVARCRHQWSDHIAVSITEDDRPVAFDFLVATEANVVATLLRCSGRAITVEDADVKISGLLQGQHRVCEHGVDAAIRLPPAKGTVESRVVSLGLALCVLVDWQLLALAPHVLETRNP